MQMEIVGPAIQATIKMAQSVVAFLQIQLLLIVVIFSIAILAIAKVEIDV